MKFFEGYVKDDDDYIVQDANTSCISKYTKY